MATKQLVSGRWHWGPDFAGYKVYVYEPGTSTSKATYSNSGLTSANTDPVVLDANGAAQIWFAGNAKVIVLTPLGSTYATDDNVNPTETQTQTGSYNLVVNGSFEDDTNADGIPDNWTRTLYTGGAFTVDTATQFNGQKSIKFTSTGTGGGYVDSTANFAVQPSKAYDVLFGIRSSVADVRNVVQVLWYKADGTASATASSTAYDDSTTNPTSWTAKIARVTAPSDAYFAKLRLVGCHNSDATSGITWFDDAGITDAVTIADTQTITGAKTFAGTVTMSSKPVNEAQGADIASAATTDIGAATGNFVDVTGTTTITALGTIQAGTRRTVRFTGSLVLTHNATSLILPGGTNITTAANDVAEFVSLGSGNWVCMNYTTAFWSTGDVKLTLKAAADTGWVLMNDGTIGNAASGGTTRANADTEALFTLLWTNILDAWAPVSTGRGASAAADFAANKTITLPRTLGRALGVSGSGATLTARALGEYLGAETHTLITAEIPSHTHAENGSSGGSQAAAYQGSGGTANATLPLTPTSTDFSTRLTTDATGSGGAHANMQPSAFLNVMIKL